ncbi:hypothetical protein BMI91_19685, partial [Thioclava sediminum]
FPAEVLTGQDSDEDVDRKIAHLAAGGLLLSVDKVSAGFDLPDLRNIISLRPTKSDQLWVQQLGRVARSADGKAHGTVYDHAGNTLRCGTLTEARDWSDGGEVSTDRQTESGERLSIRTCDECFFIFPGGTAICPTCGHDNGKDPRISQRKAIELRAVEAAEIEAARAAQAKAARREQGQAQTFKALLEQVARRPGTRNRHSARHATKHIMKSRMEKAWDRGDREAAEAIRADLAANGFKLDLPAVLQ